MTCYFISGMGADRRIFRHIRLPAHVKPAHLDWIPFEAGEGIGEYAARLSGKIDTTEPFVLVGLSLGGIIATEIARRSAPVCTIIIGSVPLSSQLPLYFRAVHKLRILGLVPPAFFKFAAICKRLFTRESRDDKILIRRMIRDADPGFIRWAMLAVLRWRNDSVPDPCWHLHGTRDEVFPIWLTRPTHVIPGGGHLLVISHSEEVNALLRQILEPYASSTQFIKQ